jgi:peptidylprolyl isomerase
MRDILISSFVCVACLMLALVSQLVSPSVVEAASPAPTDTGVQQALARSGPAATAPEASPANVPAARPAVAAPRERDAQRRRIRTLGGFGRPVYHFG